MRPHRLLIALGLVWAAFLPAQEGPVPLTSWNQARILSAMEKYAPAGATLRALSPEVSRISNQVRLFNLTMVASNGETLLRADSASLARWQRGGRVLTEIFQLEKAVYSETLVKQALQAAQSAREKLPKSNQGIPVEGGEPDGFTPALEAWVGEGLRTPFDLSTRLLLDPETRILTLDPGRLDWGPYFKGHFKAVLDGVDGADLDASAAALRRQSVLGAEANGFMAAAGPGRPGMREFSARLVVDVRQFDVRRFCDRMKIQNPLALGVIAHPLFPQQPQVRGEISMAFDRERRSVVLSPFSFEMQPGFELRLELSLADFPFQSFAGLTNLGDLSGKDAGTNEGKIERLALRFTDTGALAMALGIGGAFMNAKPEAARRQILAMAEQAGQTGVGGRPVPPEAMAALREFLSGKRSALTLRLKETSTFQRLGNESRPFFELFAVE
ncbi:MAG: hypothetical protein J0L75_00065 [Spirochaetes bacterium]|nr:hypothetical protein [Spirochaetota bacterium]